MTKVEIITPIQTKPRPRASRIGKFVHIYTPKTALTYERYIASEYQRLGGKYYEQEPIAIRIHFLFAPPKLPKYKQDFIQVIPCVIHKDLDNLAKSVLDALNTIAYKDDRQIVHLDLMKSYTKQQERVVIEINKVAYLTDKEMKERNK